MRSINMGMMALSLGAAMVVAGEAGADEMTDLKAQLRAQQAVLERLQAEIQTMQDRQAAQAAETARAVKTAQAAEQAAQGAAPSPAAAAQPGYFQIPGTNTAMKIGGYVKFDAVDDIQGNMGTSANSKTMADMGAIPLEGSVAARRNGQVNMSARESRLGVTTLTPAGEYGTLKTVIEADFYGTGSGSAVVPRLRHAYGSLGRLLAGQTWSTFMDLDTVSPELLDFGGPVGPSFVRQAQVRYSYPLAGGTLDVAIESPTGDFSSQSNDSHIDKAPDVVARYTIDPSWGHVAVAGLGRYLSNNDGLGSSDSTVAYGVLAGLGISTVGKDMLTMQTVNGNGVGRYLNQGQGYSAILDGQKRIRTIDVYGGTIGYSHFWTDALRSNVAFGYDYFSAPSTVDSLTSAHANLVWSPIPKVDIGLEYIWARISYRTPVTDADTQVTASSGTAQRVQGSVKYSF